MRRRATRLRHESANKDSTVLVQKSAVHVLGGFRSEGEHARARHEAACAQLREREPDGSGAGVADPVGVHEYFAQRHVEVRRQLHADAPACLMRDDPVDRIQRDTLTRCRRCTCVEQRCTSLRNPPIVMGKRER